MADHLLKNVWPNWQIEGEPIGRGAFGVVYEAVNRQYSMESRAAIKIVSIPQNPAEISALQSERLSEEETRSYFNKIVDNFVREIQMMEPFRGIQNIVSVEDHAVVEKEGELGWNIYIRMELLTSLDKIMGSRSMTELEVLRLGIDICTALEYCAKKRIIHRDIKPENILMNSFGNYKLGDFGIARTMENVSSGMSQKGTYNYMAPEIVKGDRYDATVDFYSLGLVLYRLLNENRLPFLMTRDQQMNPNERTAAIERRMKGEPLPNPCKASPMVAEIILKACAFEPKDRYASAYEMKKALVKAAENLYGEDWDHKKEETVSQEEEKKQEQNEQKESMEIVPTVRDTGSESEMRTVRDMGSRSEMYTVRDIAPETEETVREVRPVKDKGPDTQKSAAEKDKKPAADRGMKKKRKFLILPGAALGIFLLIGVFYFMNGNSDAKLESTDNTAEVETDGSTEENRQTSTEDTSEETTEKASEEVIVAINEENFPDSLFRKYISENFDSNGDSVLDEQEINSVEEISVDGPEDENDSNRITSLKGVEYFKNLKSLFCRNNNLSSLDVSQNVNLEVLSCGETNLSSLDVSQNVSLKKLYCYSTNLSSLDVSQNGKLRELACIETDMSILDVSQNANLEVLYCGETNLSSLDVSQNANLEVLDCHKTNLSSLDVSQNVNLEMLDCHKMDLSSLDVSQNANLEVLYCYGTNLSSLDVSRNVNLKELACGETNLSSLDVRMNTNLTYLNVNDSPSLEYVYCREEIQESVLAENCPKLQINPS